MDCQVKQENATQGVLSQIQDGSGLTVIRIGIMCIYTYPYVLDHRPSNQKIGAYQPDYGHLHGMEHSGCFCNDGLNDET